MASPTLNDLAVHFDSVQYRRRPPLLCAPVLLPLSTKVPYASLLNSYADIMRICPPSTIGPIKGYNSSEPASPIPLYIEFPVSLPTADEPWSLSMDTPRVPLWNNRDVIVPILGEGFISDFIDFSPTGATLVIPLKHTAGTVYIRVPWSRLPLFLNASLKDTDIFNNRRDILVPVASVTSRTRVGPLSRLRKATSLQSLTKLLRAG
ncbi:hypothetical protein PYCCODRAFT_1467409 [Trametes coccinea BRFM310]|uniref:Uncharacterized protein n=1 Tax=Trametes coccinea (strain BRFM310) TaxID=1353009 RepID=A0A1Y2IPQ9_TRAC3|nr:hypothetical protein PYCCODRAFT_1467409 [Trametes coccinea BRFM310]